MNTKSRHVLKGWLELSSDERQWVAKEINDSNEKTTSEKDILKKSLNENLGITFGPLENGCPCCGK